MPAHTKCSPAAIRITTRKVVSSAFPRTPPASMRYRVMNPNAAVIIAVSDAAHPAFVSLRSHRRQHIFDIDLSCRSMENGSR